MFKTNRVITTTIIYSCHIILLLTCIKTHTVQWSYWLQKMIHFCTCLSRLSCLPEEQKNTYLCFFLQVLSSRTKEMAYVKSTGCMGMVAYAFNPRTGSRGSEALWVQGQWVPGQSELHNETVLGDRRTQKRALAAFQRTQVEVLEPTWWLTIVWNSSSRMSETQVPGDLSPIPGLWAYLAYQTYTWLTYIHTGKRLIYRK